MTTTASLKKERVKDIRLVGSQNGYNFPVLSEPIYDMATQPIPGYQHLLRGDNRAHLCINSQRYSIRVHEDVVRMGEEAIKKFPDLTKADIFTVLIRHGARLSRYYRFPHVKVQVDAGDPIELALVLSNSYDRSCRVGFTLGAFKGNVLYYAGKAFLTMRKKHYDSLNLAEMSRDIEVAIENFTLLEKEWKEWKDEKLTKEEGSELIEKSALPEKYVEKIMAVWEAEEMKSKWDLFGISCMIIQDLGKSEERNETLATKLCKVFYR